MCTLKKLLPSHHIKGSRELIHEESNGHEQHDGNSGNAILDF